MSRTRKIVVAAVVCLFAATIAFATSAHFNKCSKAAQGNNLSVSFKESGLDGDQTCITVTADASANYACYNNGGKNPSAANKRTVSAQRTATDCFTPHNGQITGTLTITPPGPGDFSCPPGQTLRLDSVTYSNVRVVDTTHNVTCSP